MKDIRIRGLKACASELIRHVPENNATYTRPSHAVGVLVPPDYVVPDRSATGENTWKRLRRLTGKIGRRTSARFSALRALEQFRR